MFSEMSPNYNSVKHTFTNRAHLSVRIIQENATFWNMCEFCTFSKKQQSNSKYLVGTASAYGSHTLRFEGSESRSCFSECLSLSIYTSVTFFLHSCSPEGPRMTAQSRIRQALLQLNQKQVVLWSWGCLKNNVCPEPGMQRPYFHKRNISVIHKQGLKQEKARLQKIYHIIGMQKNQL